MFYYQSQGLMGQVIGLVLGLFLLVMSLAVLLIILVLLLCLTLLGRFGLHQYLKATDLNFARVRWFAAPQATRLEDAFDHWFFQIWEATGVNLAAATGSVFVGAFLICQLTAGLIGGALLAGRGVSYETFQSILLIGTISGLGCGLKLLRSTRLWFPGFPAQDVRSNLRKSGLMAGSTGQPKPQTLIQRFVHWFMTPKP